MAVQPKKHTCTKNNNKEGSAPFMQRLGLDLDMFDSINDIEIRAYFDNHRSGPEGNLCDVAAACGVEAADAECYKVGQTRE